ncbi:MAG: hypothetical protein ACNA8R_02130 [Nitriliruptoraceae bacterium]
MNPAFHSIVVHVLTGTLIFGTGAAVALFALRFSVLARFRYLAPAADMAALFAIWIGTLVSLAAMVTGAAIHSLEASLNSPVIRNKISSGILLIVSYGLFLFLRHRIGPRLWNNDLMAGFAAFLTAAGLHWNIVTNSIGGTVAGVPSGYENIVRFSGVETRFTYYLPSWTLLLIAAVGVGMLVLAFTDRRSKDGVADDALVGSD